LRLLYFRPIAQLKHTKSIAFIDIPAEGSEKSVAFIAILAEDIKKALRLLTFLLEIWLSRRRERREVHIDCKKSIENCPGNRFPAASGGAAIRTFATGREQLGRALWRNVQLGSAQG
jgi:hypothetical protein